MTEILEAQFKMISDLNKDLDKSKQKIRSLQLLLQQFSPTSPPLNHTDGRVINQLIHLLLAGQNPVPPHLTQVVMDTLRDKYRAQKLDNLFWKDEVHRLHEKGLERKEQIRQLQNQNARLEDQITELGNRNTVLEYDLQRNYRDQTRRNTQSNHTRTTQGRTTQARTTQGRRPLTQQERQAARNRLFPT